MKIADEKSIGRNLYLKGLLFVRKTDTSNQREWIPAEEKSERMDSKENAKKKILDGFFIQLRMLNRCALRGFSQSAL
jgi:hypothetical protein